MWLCRGCLESSKSSVSSICDFYDWDVGCVVVRPESRCVVVKEESKDTFAGRQFNDAVV